jgi:toxin-antitoxin system PIN domain toxin
VIAVDTNLLVYAHRRDSPWHAPALECVRSLAEARSAWAIPWSCLHEFIAIVTHPKIYRPPSTPAEALDQADVWLESPSLVLLGEAQGYWSDFRGVLERSRVVGPQVHDAHVAALCRHHGVRELWSADRDFSRFPDIPFRNALVRPSPS